MLTNTLNGKYWTFPSAPRAREETWRGALEDKEQEDDDVLVQTPKNSVFSVSPPPRSPR